MSIPPASASCAHAAGQTYMDPIKRFSCFRGKRHPKETGVEELRAVSSFVSYIKITSYCSWLY